MMSGRWFRIAPDDSSTPLQTMSYCHARISRGSLVSSASSSPCGIEKGLWLKSILPVSSSASNIGKSTIQHISNLFRSEEHTSELQSLMSISYDVVCLKKKTQYHYNNHHSLPPT